MKQLLILAYRLLVSDRGKYMALLLGTTFSAFLIVQMKSTFAGLLTKASATVVNVGAKVWVMDPVAANTLFGSIPMPDFVPDTVRSMDGVKYAVPLYVGASLLRLRDGTINRSL
jgi:putative ABC transport system permease protein